MHHLWLRQATIPLDLVNDWQELELCKLFKCTPAELDEQDIHRVRRLLAIQRGLDRYHAADAEAKARRG